MDSYDQYPNQEQPVRTESVSDAPPDPIQIETQKSYFWHVLVFLVILVAIIVGGIALNRQQRQQVVAPNAQIDSSIVTPPVNQAEGRLCRPNSPINSEIVYYESENRYYLQETEPPIEVEPGKFVSSVTNFLFDGQYHYFWVSGNLPEEFMPEASMYTIEEGKQLGIDAGYQIKAVKNQQETCTTWVVDPQKFIPPADVTFATTAQMKQETTDSFNESILEACRICLTNYNNREEQIQCFSIGNIFTQYPQEVIEQSFDQYCLNQ